MTDPVADALSISQALFRAWNALDVRLSLPSLVMRQIDEQRTFTPRTRSIREFFEAVCYEGLLLGEPWHRTTRVRIPLANRSSYLEWLFAQRFDMQQAHDEHGLIYDPAYCRWGRLKYGDNGSADQATWRRYFAEERKAALEDCVALQGPLVDAGSPVSTPPRRVQLALENVFAQAGLRYELVSLAAEGFGLRIPLGLGEYHLECQIRDIPALRKRVIPFAFEIASGASGQRLLLSSTDQEIWPGASAYRTTCTANDALEGACTALSLFAQALRSEFPQT